MFDAQQPSSRRAFTLLELLVVIGIIAVLIGVLIVALVSARRTAAAAHCKANLRQIGMGIRLYANQNRDVLHEATDRHHWTKVWPPAGDPTSAMRLTRPVDSDAYWGVAYLPYLAGRATVDATGEAAAQITEFARKIWLCPSSSGVSVANGNFDATNPVSYGINGRITGTSGPLRFRKLSRYRRPAELIVAHDAVEPRLEDRQGDSLSNYGTASNLTQWRPPLGVAYVTGQHRSPLAEYYRHRRRCNVLWLDGHVSDLPESLGQDVPARWYEGT